jgi:hypothetical protein
VYVSFGLSVSLSSCYSLRITELVFIKSDIAGFIKIYCYIPVLLEIGQQY